MLLQMVVYPRRVHITMSFLKITNPKKRDQLVADFIATKKRIQQRNLNERAEHLAEEDNLQNLFKPMIQSAEKSTTALQEKFLPLQNELKDINVTLKDVSIKKDAATKDVTLEDILEMYGISNPSNLDNHFSIQRVRDGYMMGMKKVKFDKPSNIYNDDRKFDGTLGLWKMIMLKKPPVLDDREDMTNYEQLLKQTNVINNPLNVAAGQRPYQTHKYKRFFSSLPLFQQQGHGIQFLPKDIKGLEKKFEILLGEYRAGNKTSTRNEIVAIADELLRRKVIPRQEYRDINTYLAESLS